MSECDHNDTEVFKRVREQNAGPLAGKTIEYCPGCERHIIT